MLQEDLIKDTFIRAFEGGAEFDNHSGQSWDSAANATPYVPLEYISSSLTYQEAYIRCFYEKVVNLSVIIQKNWKPVAVWPITLIYHNGECWLSTNEKEILPPLFADKVTSKVKSSVITCCINAINAVCKLCRQNFTVRNVQTRCSQLSAVRSTSDIMFSKLMEAGGEADITTDLYVDLGMEIDEIHTQIRRRYRSLINNASRLWNARILESVSADEMELFKLKHIETAGRKTRSDETWELQRQAVNAGHGFIIKLTDSDGGFVGESLFEYSRDEGTYAVGVYNRALFDRPVSHIVQWKAIEHMKELELKKYKVGQRFWPGESLHLRAPTEKELSISYFKQGFATDMVHTIIVTNKFPDQS